MIVQESLKKLLELLKALFHMNIDCDYRHYCTGFQFTGIYYYF
jgi:hypothetical protein